MSWARQRWLVLLVMELAALWYPGRTVSADARTPNPDTRAQWVTPDREQALERLFLFAAGPLIQAGVAGAYGHNIQFDNEKVVSLQQHTRYPGILRVVVEVKTFYGAHNYVGVDQLEFTCDYGGVRLTGATHKPYPRLP